MGKEASVLIDFYCQPRLSFKTLLLVVKMYILSSRSGVGSQVVYHTWSNEPLSKWLLWVKSEERCQGQALLGIQGTAVNKTKMFSALTGLRV